MNTNKDTNKGTNKGTNKAGPMKSGLKGIKDADT